LHEPRAELQIETTAMPSTLRMVLLSGMPKEDAMKSDTDIRHGVEAELLWGPSLSDAIAIGVAVKNGVTTIGGKVRGVAALRVVDKS
jgi:osmotically-inducible protein OsmY